MSKINQHFVDQVIYRAGLTEKVATDLFKLLCKALSLTNKEDYIKKEYDLPNNRSVYRFKYSNDKIGYCIVDNLKKRPITFLTRPIMSDMKKRTENQKAKSKAMREQTDFLRYVKGM